MAVRVKKVWFLLGVLSICLVCSSCEVMDAVFTTAFSVSPEEEIQLGAAFRKELHKDLKFVNDPEILGYVRRVGNIVVSNSPDMAVVPTEFFVVHNDEINAFAIPGGTIYVHTGLIAAAEDEAELASVLGHEFGHVVYRHGIKHVSRAQGWGLISKIILGQDAAREAQLVGQILAQGVLQNYSRRDELEADSIAIPTLYRANYDPAGMIGFFQTLEERYGGGGGGLVTLFASHPPTAERIDRVRAQIEALPPKDTLYRPVKDLRRVQARMFELGISAE